MLRNVWTVISIFAVANMIALAGLFAWLSSTQRLNASRLDQTRMLFAQTLPQELEAQASEEVEAEQQAAIAAQQARIGTTPLTAEDRLNVMNESDEIMRQRYERHLRETRDLEKTISAELSRLGKERAELEAAKRRFAEMRREVAEREGNEQFEKAVQLYQSLKPDQSRDMMLTLINDGETEQVVGYLNALQTRISSKIISEFAKDDPVLAAELLERLRTYGVEAVASEG